MLEPIAAVTAPSFHPPPWRARLGRLAIGLALLSACGATGALPSAAVDLNRRGAEALGESQVDDAEARFRLAIEHHPRFAEPHANLGVVMLERGRLEEAERHLRDAIALDPDLDEAWSNLGVVLHRQGRIDEAALSFEHALSIDPGLFSARQNLAELWILRRQFDEARAHLMRLVQLTEEGSPAWARAHAMLAFCELRLGLEPEAVARAGRVLDLKPHEPIALVVRGILHTRRGDYEDALRDLTEAARDPLSRYDAQLRLAGVYVALGRLEEAGRLIPNLIWESSDAEQPAIRLIASWWAYESGQYEDACRHAEVALVVDPHLGEAVELLERAKRALGL